MHPQEQLIQDHGQDSEQCRVCQTPLEAHDLVDGHCLVCEQDAKAYDADVVMHGPVTALSHFLDRVFYDPTEAAHNLEVSLERGNMSGDM